MTSLGLFIIDENQYPPSWNRTPELDIIGGGLSYAVIGARIVSGPKYSKRITGIVDMGLDFPPAIKKEIESWDTGLIFRSDSSRMTTRGINIYREDGVRDFKYISPKKRILGEDILEVQPLANLRTYHFCCAIDRCESTIDDFLERSSLHVLSKPKFIFEPFPDVCVPQNLAALESMLHKVDVFSPNLHESASFHQLEKSAPSEELIRGLAEKFHKFQTSDGGVVLRCGELGCYVLSDTVSVMLPAYHIDQEKVVDVTGGGNSFCGAFVTALELSGDWLLSAVLATVASGIVIEKLGMPTLQNEFWNNETVKERLSSYIDRNRALLLELNVNLIDQW